MRSTENRGVQIWVIAGFGLVACPAGALGAGEPAPIRPWLKTWVSGPPRAQTIPPQPLPLRANEQVLWDNGQVPGPHGWSSQFDPVYPFDSSFADDFVVSEHVPQAVGTASITRVDWIGTFS